MICMWIVCCFCPEVGFIVSDLIDVALGGPFRIFGSIRSVVNRMGGVPPATDFHLMAVTVLFMSGLVPSLCHQQTTEIF